MTGLLPSREDDYRVTPEMVRSAELFSFVFGDLAQRLKEREALEATFEALIEEGTTAALTQIATNVAPQLADLQDDILAAQAEIEAILGTGEISPFVKVNILPAQNDAAILTALGIPALFDALRSEIMGGTPAAALDTIYELAEQLADDGDAIAAINAAIATKLNASAVSAWVLGNLLSAGDKAAARAVLGIVMDDADKTKLNGIAAGANATPALSDPDILAGTSTDKGAVSPVQMKSSAEKFGGISAPTAGDTYLIWQATTDDTEFSGGFSWGSNVGQEDWQSSFSVTRTNADTYARISKAGAVRLKYEYQGSGTTVEVRVYKNGTIIDSFTGAAGAYTSKSLDVSVAVGDLLCVAIRRTGGSGTTATLRRIKVYSGTSAYGAVF